MDGEPDPARGLDPGSVGETSWTLVESARRGDEASREQIVFLYEPLVRGRYLRSVAAQDADAVCQEIFLTVFARLGEFERMPKGKSFRPWIYRIAFHKVGDYLRQQRHEVDAAGGTDALERLQQIPDPAWDESTDPDTPDELAAEQGLYRRLMELASREFQPKTWTAAVRAIGGEGAASVGQDLGLSANAVRVAKFRVLGRLRELLRDLGEPERTMGTG